MRDVSATVVAREIEGQTKLFLVATIDGENYEYECWHGASHEAVGKIFTDWSFGDTFHDITVKDEKYYAGGYFKTPCPERPANAYFPDVESREIGFNDGIESRSRHTRLLLYTRNNVYQFNGSSIEGVCAIIGTPQYHKNGKWSSTTYRIQLAAGVKHSQIRQGWDSGLYVDNHTSMKDIASDLGLEGVQPYAVEEYIKTHMISTYVRHMQHLERMEALEAVAEQQGAEMIPYTYVRKCTYNRQGDNFLLINREVWYDDSERNDVKIVKRTHVSGYKGGTTTYELMILSTLETEEIHEYSRFGEDALETRGYFKENGRWVRPQAEPEQPEQSGTEGGWTVNDLLKKFNG